METLIVIIAVLYGGYRIEKLLGKFDDLIRRIKIIEKRIEKIYEWDGGYGRESLEEIDRIIAKSKLKQDEK